MSQSSKRDIEASDSFEEAPPEKRRSPPEMRITFYRQKHELPRIANDPHNEDVHAQWDEAILKQGLEPGVELLMSLVAQCKTLNQKFADEREAKGLYQSSQAVRDELKACHDSGSYRSLRNAIILQTPKVHEARKTLSTSELIEKYLNDTASKMSSCASGTVQLTEWDSSPRSSLHIPGGPRGIFPELLMHQIGEWSSAGGEMADTVAKAFRVQHPTFVFNASGTGKTRLTFEGLCQHWGFYFSCAVDSESPHGSYDLTQIILDLQTSSKFTSSVPLKRNDHSHSRIAQNRDMTFRAFLRLWLSRLLIFKQFLMNLPSTTTREEGRRRWLILQVYPAALLGADCFSNLIRPLDSADTDFMLRKIEDTYGSIKKLVSPDEPLFAVFDEAQVAARECSQAFLSDDYKRHIPLLGEIIATWERVAPTVTLIVSGTCPFTDVRRNSVSSPIGDPGGWSMFTEVGAFDRQEAQERYILKYIWPNVKERNDLPYREQLLLDRAWRWLRGRYRSTASFVSTLLRVDVETAHPFLNYTVQRLTGFKPTDCHDFAQINLPKSSKELIDKAPVIKFKGLGDSKAVRLRLNIFQVFLRSLFQSGTLVSSSDQDQFVKIGAARICEPTGLGPKEIHLDEPISLLSLSKWFHARQCEGRGRTREEPSICDYSTPLLETLAFYFRSILDGEMHLNNVVEFATEKPTWSNEPVRLITILGQTSDGGTRTCTVSPTEGPSPILGMRSRDEDDMRRWLKDSDGVAFCFPHENFGADIVFLIDAGGRYIWVTVQCYLHGQVKTLVKENPAKATHPAESTELDSQKDEQCPPLEIRPYPVPPMLRASSFDTTGRQKTRVTRGDPDSVLRLIASFPNRPDESSIMKVAKESPSPLAFVNMERLLENMRPLIPQIDRELGT